MFICGCKCWCWSIQGFFFLPPSTEWRGAGERAEPHQERPVHAAQDSARCRTSSPSGWLQADLMYRRRFASPASCRGDRKSLQGQREAGMCAIWGRGGVWRATLVLKSETYFRSILLPCKIFPALRKRNLSQISNCPEVTKQGKYIYCELCVS